MPRIGKRWVSDPFFTAYQKDDSFKSRVHRFCRQRPSCVILILIAFVFILFLWRKQSNLSFPGPTSSEYSIVFDAGSTGTRVHVYKFEIQGNALILQNDDFHSEQPGVSHYAGSPSEAADSLTPLLDSIKDSIPFPKVSKTPCQLRATAGLRLLPGNQAQEILNETYKKLKTTEYSVDANSVSILEGNYEGAYAWLTLNYLLEK